MFWCHICHFVLSKAFQKICLNISFGGVFVLKWLLSTQKVRVALRIIAPSNLQLPQRVWASAQQSLSKLAFAFALHHSCTLPEPALVPPRSLQVYPQEATKRLHRTRFKTTPMFCHSYTDVLMKQRRCFKEAAAKHQRGGGKRVVCRHQFKRGCRGYY